ncbi:MAG TPA: VWA domain-containing protein [Bryobacteraceae bacterium]|nr:VWA domain-containing protein [Bryobacteraceae bacterium]
MIRVGFGVLSACCLLAFGLPGAQTSAPSSPTQDQPPSAQAQSGSPQKSISVSVNEVIVPVTVTDEKGRFVSDLDQKDFQIFDEGKPQKIEYFSRERNQPVVVGFLIDQSNASRIHWKAYQDSAAELALTLLPGDEKFSGYLIGYGNDAELLVNTTHDGEKIVEKIRAMKPGGGAALYDAIYRACTSRELVKGEPVEPRRVIVIVGDGHDNSSKKTLNEVLELAQRNLVTIYGVSTVAFGFNNADEANLIKLAEETGGRVAYPLQGVYKDISGYLSTPQDAGNYSLTVGTGGYASELANSLFRAVADIAGEVTTQYILRYIPSENDVKPKQFRNLNVKVSLSNVKVRARKGYYPLAP